MEASQPQLRAEAEAGTEEVRLSRQLADALSAVRPEGMTEGKKKKRKAVWAGIILDNPEFLITWFKRHVAPLHSKVHAHHMTVIYKPTPAQMAKLKLGDVVRLRVVAYAADDKGQAVKVAGYTHPGANRAPHITVATNGVSPVYSNELLKTSLNLVTGPNLTGRIGFFDGKVDRFDTEGTIYEEWT